jgi:CRP/FNR family transcriptional regulator, cyclic AMP receptor protein
MIKVDVLKNIYLFKDMTNEELQKLSKVCISKECIAGQELFFTGQKADSFFVIQHGTINITRTSSGGDDLQLTTIGSNSHFGEMPFLTGETRTANAKATENTTLIEVPFDSLKNFLNEETKISDKFHRAIAHYLAKRLQNTTGDLSKAKEAMLKD